VQPSPTRGRELSAAEPTKLFKKQLSAAHGAYDCFRTDTRRVTPDHSTATTACRGEDIRRRGTGTPIAALACARIAGRDWRLDYHEHHAPGGCAARPLEADVTQPLGRRHPPSIRHCLPARRRQRRQRAGLLGQRHASVLPGIEAHNRQITTTSVLRRNASTRCSSRSEVATAGDEVRTALEAGKRPNVGTVRRLSAGRHRCGDRTSVRLACLCHLWRSTIVPVPRSDRAASDAGVERSALRPSLILGRVRGPTTR